MVKGLVYEDRLEVLSIWPLEKKNETGIAGLQPMSYQKIFSQGMITNLLNPKVAIFFLSFLPQFINPQSHYVKEQIAFLGLWFDVQGCIILAIVASLTGFFRHLLLHNKTFWNWQEKITGAILVGLGIRMLLSKK